MRAFEMDFYSKLWFTYRKDMPEFPGTGITTDCGWGCMVRSAQMMMAQGLMLHWLNRDWRLCPAHTESPPQSSLTERLHRDIVRLFADTDDTYAAPFSIHNLVRLGRNIGKQPGQWYGPGSTAHLLQLAAANSQASLLHSLAVYVAQDCTVYKDDVTAMCAVKTGLDAAEVTEHDFTVVEQEDRSSTMQYSFSEEVTVDGESWCLEQESSRIPDPTWKSLVVLIPVRLGGERFNPLYSSCLRSLLTLPSCLGWIGGRPTHSLYFIGFQEDDLIHLDPHRLQSCVDATQLQFPLASFHSQHPRKLNMRKMDPSCCLGFYLRTRDEFESWCLGIQEFATPPPVEGRAQYPIFTVVEGRGEESSSEDWASIEPQGEGGQESGQIQSEEFVFI